MLPADFRDVCAGVNKKIERETRSLRKLAFFSLIPHAKEGFSFNSIMEMWPLPGDEKMQSEKYDPSIDKDLYEQMIKHHQIKRRAKK